MARRERVLRGRLGLPKGLIERSAHPTLSPDHPSDEDLSLGTPGRRKDGARGVRVKKRASRNASTPVAGGSVVAISAQDDQRMSTRRGRQS
jgi:hypothetical protein